MSSSTRESKKKDYKTLFLIHQFVDSTKFEKLALANLAKETWDILNNSYGGVDKIKKVKFQSLRRQYELLSMKDQESIRDYFTRIQMLVNLMKACSGKLLDQQIVDKILGILAFQFDHIVVTIEEAKDLQRMQVKELQSSLEAYKQRLLKSSSMRVVAQALNDGGGNKNKKGKWKNKLKDSNEGQKISNQISGGNNYKNNRGHGNFSKKGDKCYSNKGKQKKKVEAQMAQGDSDDLYSDHVLLMVITSDYAKSDFWHLDTRSLGLQKKKGMVHGLSSIDPLKELYEGRKKLDDKGQPMMSFGYDSTSAYKLYNPTSKKIVLSKDVVVDESKGWRWETTTENDKRLVIASTGCKAAFLNEPLEEEVCVCQPPGFEVIEEDKKTLMYATNDACKMQNLATSIAIAKADLSDHNRHSARAHTHE
ncbi:hypothetical protein CR513_32089, partial [Mucuna pruriens]